MQLNSYEMEFLAELCEVLTTKQCKEEYIYPVWTEDTEGCMIFTDDAQDIFNEIYDTYETMYINVVKKPMLDSHCQEDIDNHLIKLSKFWGMSW